MAASMAQFINQNGCFKGDKSVMSFFCRQWLMYADSVAGSPMSVPGNGRHSWTGSSNKTDKLQDEEDTGGSRTSLWVLPAAKSTLPITSSPSLLKKQRSKCFPGFCLMQLMECPPSVILLCSLGENEPPQGRVQKIRTVNCLGSSGFPTSCPAATQASFLFPVKSGT